MRLTPAGEALLEPARRSRASFQLARGAARRRVRGRLRQALDAFFRNLNLGQGWSPTRPQLVAAYEAAGATEVVNVQGNGTVVFTAPAPRRVTDAVLRSLADLTGYADIAVVRRATWVIGLVAGFGALDLRNDEPSEVVLFDARAWPVAVPWTSPDGRLRILAGDRRHAVTSYRPGAAGGGSNAGPVLQEDSPA